MAALAEGISASRADGDIRPERTLQTVETKLRQLKEAKHSIDLLELKNFATQKLFDVVGCLNTDRKRAKNELRQHPEELRMIPTRDGGGHPYYCGEGDGR